MGLLYRKQLVTSIIWNHYQKKYATTRMEYTSLNCPANKDHGTNNQTAALLLNCVDLPSPNPDVALVAKIA